MHDDNRDNDVWVIMEALKTLAPAVIIGSLWALSWANLRSDLNVMEAKLNYHQETLQELRDEIRMEFTRRQAIEDRFNERKQQVHSGWSAPGGSVRQTAP